MCRNFFGNVWFYTVSGQIFLRNLRDCDVKQQKATYRIQLHTEVLIMHANHLLFSKCLIPFLSRRRGGTEIYSVGRSMQWKVVGPCSEQNCTKDGFCQVWICGWFSCILGIFLQKIDQIEGDCLYIEYLGRAVWIFRDTERHIETHIGACGSATWILLCYPLIIPFKPHK